MNYSSGPFQRSVRFFIVLGKYFGLFAFGMALLTACSSQPRRVMADFEPYLTPQERVERNVTIVFGELYSRTHRTSIASIAECQRFAFENQIVVYQPEWVKLSQKQRAWVIRHELGHCIQSLEHDERVKDDGCPLTIMHPHVPPDRCLKIDSEVSMTAPLRK